MSDRIIANPDNAKAVELKEVVEDMRRALDGIRALSESFDSMVRDVGSGPTYDQIELELGLQAGEGQTLYNLMAAAKARVDHFDVLTFIARND